MAYLVRITTRALREIDCEKMKELPRGTVAIRWFVVYYGRVPCKSVEAFAQAEWCFK